MVFPAKRVLNWGASRGARAGRRALLAAGWLAASAFSAPSATRRQLPEAAAPPTPASAPTEQLTPNSRRAYDEVLKLRLAPARALLQAELARTPTAPAPLLVADCADFI